MATPTTLPITIPAMAPPLRPLLVEGLLVFRLSVMLVNDDVQSIYVLTLEKALKYLRKLVKKLVAF